MSVIVMGMEMPGKCESCLLRYRHQGAYCTDHCYATPKHKNIDPWTFGRARNGDRPDWCPLRPLPEKHGRLGDLDELKTSFADSINECKKWIKELEENGDNETLVLANQAFCTFVEAALRLKSIPTIVEAEGE